MLHLTQAIPSKFKWFLLALGCLFLLGFTSISLGKNQPDWWQTAGKGIDIGVSHNDKRWLLGQNGEVYRWNPEKKDWLKYGSKRNFAHIDAANNGGAAALNQKGRLFITSGNGRWISAGVRAEDVGIGGGWIWLAGASLGNGKKTVLRAPFTLDKELNWQEMQGNVSRIDVDAEGRGWALDSSGALFAHTGKHWVAIQNNPPGSDIGVGGNGEVYLVSNKKDISLGGGKLYLRNPDSGNWDLLKGRFLNISASGSGQPFGVDSQQSFLIAGTNIGGNQPGSGKNSPNPENPKGEENQGPQFLYELAGEGAYLPEQIAQASIDNITEEANLITGETYLNGLLTKVAIYTPQDSDISNIVLAYDNFSFRDYAPDFRGTALDDLDQFDDLALVLVPAENEDQLPSLKTASLLERFAARTELKTHKLKPGINLLGTADLTNLDDGNAITQLLAINDSEITLKQVLKDTLFVNVTPTTKAAQPLVSDELRTPENIALHYGSAFFDNLVISAKVAIGEEGVPLGPSLITKANWSISLGSDLGIEVTTDIDFPISSGTVLQAKGTKLTYEHSLQAFHLVGGLTRKKAQNLVDVQGITLSSANFTGTFIIPNGDPEQASEEEPPTDGPGSPPTTSLQIAGLSSFSSQSREPREISYNIDLSLNEDETQFDYALTLAGGVMLADITGTAIPIINNVELTRVEINDELIAGHLTMDGREVRVARYTGDKVQKPLIMFLHEDVNLASYIPHINETVLGSFSLGTAALFTIEGTADEEVTTFESNESLPEIMAEFFNSNQPGLFPIQVKNGLSLVGFYDANEVSEEEAAAFDDLSIPKEGYVAKGHFDVAVVNNLALSPISDNEAETDPATKTETSESRLFNFDLQFNISAFTIPNTEKYLTFNGSVFNLSREGGSIETSIATGIELALKEDSGINLGGVRKLAMAGKVALEKSTEDNDTAFSVKIAASTALNIDQATQTSFANLQHFEHDDSSSKEAPVEAESSEDESSEKTKEPAPQGWKNAFGIPTLTLYEIALYNTFESKNNQGAQHFSIWSKADLGTEPITFTGSIELEHDLAENSISVESASLMIPGPINLNNLPAIQEVPKVNEFIVSDIEMTLDSFAGKLDWPAQAKESDASPFGQFYFGPAKAEQGHVSSAPPTEQATGTSEEHERNLIFIARAERLASKMLQSDIPEPIGSVEMGPAYFALRFAEAESLDADELPEHITPFVEDLIADGTQLLLADGIMLGGKIAPDSTGHPLITELTSQLSITEPLLLSGSITEDPTDSSAKVRLTAAIEGFSVPEIPAEILSFGATTLVLDNTEADSLTLSSNASVSPPMTELKLDMVGELTFTQESNKKSLSYCFAPAGLNGCEADSAEETADTENTGTEENTELAAAETTPKNENSEGSTPTTNVNWADPLGIGGVTLNNLAFLGEIEYQGEVKSQDCAFEGHATFGSVVAKGSIPLCEGIGSGKVDLKTSQEIENNSYIYIEKEIALSDLPRIPKVMTNALDGSVEKFLLAKQAISGRFKAQIDTLSLSGRGSLAANSTDFMLMVKKEDVTDLSPIIPSKLSPLDQIQIPSGLFIISNKQQSAFGLDHLPDVLFDDLFKGLIDDKTGVKLHVNDGITFITKANLEFFPEVTRDILGASFGIGNDIVLGGGIGGLFTGDDRKVSLYTHTTGFTLPDLPGGLISINDANAKVFVSKELVTGITGPLTVGLATDALLKLPQLDDPGTFSDPLNTTLQLDYQFGETSTPTLTLSATVNDKWDGPMGFEDLSLTDASVGIGLSPTGTIVSVSTSKAIFRENQFFFDLNSAWAGGVPTQLATQFGRPRNEDGTLGPTLLVTPTTQMALTNSLFKLALKGSNNLASNVMQRLPNDPVAAPALNYLRNAMSSSGSDGADAMLNLIESSPLNMVALRNPEIYFVTPGDSLPAKSSVRPPLGLGLHAEGELLLDLVGLQANLANGIYKVNLLDGFYLNAKINAASPFDGNNFSVSGNQPIIPIAGGQKVKLSGSLAMPGLSLIDGIPAIGEGSFSLEKKQLKASTPPASSILIGGNVSIFGLPGRHISAEISPSTAWMEAPRSGCFDIPIRVKAEMSFPEGGDPWSVVTASAFRIYDDIPNPLDCGGELLAKLGEAAKMTAWAASQGAEYAYEGFRSVVGIGQGVIGLAGPLGAPINNAINEIRDLSTNSLDAMKSGDPLALGNSVASALGNVVGGFIGGLGDLFGKKSEPPRYFYVTPQRCMEHQIWNPIFKSCFHRDAMVIMHTGRSDGGSICMRNNLSTDDFIATKCDGTDRNHFIFNEQARRIQTVDYYWHGTQHRWIIHSSHTRCAEAYLNDVGQKSVRLADNCTNADSQKWSYSPSGNFVTTALGGNLCIAVPEDSNRTAPSTGALTLVDCNHAWAQPEGNSLNWTASSVFPDYARKYKHAIDGHLVQRGQCMQSFGELHTGIYSLMSDQERSSCHKWRINYTEDGLTELVMQNNHNGWAVAMGWNKDNVNDQNYHYKYSDREDANLEAHWTMALDQPLQYDPNNRGKAFSIDGALIVFKDPEFGRCLTRDSNTGHARKMIPCNTATIDNYFQFYPTDISQARLAADIQFEETVQKEIRDQNRIMTGDSEGVFSAVIFAESSRCLSRSQQHGIYAVSLNDDESCYPATSIQRAEVGMNNIQRIFVSGANRCLSISPDGVPSVEHCIYGREQQLWLKQTYENGFFALANVATETCLSQTKGGTYAPVELAECGAPSQLLHLAKRMDESKTIPSHPSTQTAVDFEQLTAEQENGIAAQFAQQLQFVNADKCLSGVADRFYSTTGEMTIEAHDCLDPIWEDLERQDTNPPAGITEADTAFGLYPATELTSSNNEEFYRIKSDSTGACLSLPVVKLVNGETYIDMPGDPNTIQNVPLLPRACREGSTGQIWKKRAENSPNSFKLQGTDAAAGFCLDLANAEPTATRCGASSQDMRLIGPAKKRSTETLALAEPIVPSLEQRPQGEEQIAIPEPQPFTPEYALFKGSQTVGYGWLQIIKPDNNGNAYCLASGGFSREVMAESQEDYFNVNSNLGLKRCENGNNRNDIALYKAETLGNNSIRIYFRNDKQCLTMPLPNTGGVLRLSACEYGSAEQIFELENGYLSHKFNNKSVYYSAKEDGLDNGFIFLVNGNSEFYKSESISFINQQGSTPADLTMMAMPTVSGTLKTSYQDYVDMNNAAAFESHALQLRLGNENNTQQCLEVRNSDRPERRLGAAGCGDSTSPLQVSKAFRYYDAEIAGTYRLRSEATEQCLMLPTTKDENGNDQLAWQIKDQQEVDQFCQHSSQDNFLYDDIPEVLRDGLTRGPMYSRAELCSTPNLRPPVLLGTCRSDSPNQLWMKPDYLGGGRVMSYLRSKGDYCLAVDYSTDSSGRAINRLITSVCNQKSLEMSRMAPLVEKSTDLRLEPPLLLFNNVQ